GRRLGGGGRRLGRAGRRFGGGGRRLRRGGRRLGRGGRRFGRAGRRLGRARRGFGRGGDRPGRARRRSDWDDAGSLGRRPLHLEQTGVLVRNGPGRESDAVRVASTAQLEK